MLIRLSSMGDVIIQTAFAKYLKYVLPDAKLSLITAQEFEATVASSDIFDEIILYKRRRGLSDIWGLIQTAKKVKSTGPNFIFDLHSNTRSRIISFLSFIPQLGIDKRSWLRILLIKFKVNLLKGVSSQHKRTIEDFQFLFDSNWSWDNLFIQEKSQQLTLIKETSAKVRPVVCISPVASFGSKRWPVAYYQELINLLLNDVAFSDLSIEIIAGPGDVYCKDLGKGQERVLNKQGQTSLQESIDLISSSLVCLTNDTGAAHIAEASGVPSIVLFGSTSPDFGFRPHLKTSHFFYKSLSCSPCSATGAKSCYKHQHECMLAISPQEVFKKLKELVINVV